MLLARIFTENVNRRGIESIVSRYFDGFTIVDSVGYWRGKREDSLIVEIVFDGKDKPKVEAICREINIVNKQECCMLQYLPATIRFV